MTKEIVDWLIAKACEGKGAPAPELLAQARAILDSLEFVAIFPLFLKVEYGDRGDAVPVFTQLCRTLYPEPRLVSSAA